MQTDATFWAQTMLHVIGQQCCDHVRKRAQQVTTLLHVVDQQSCVHLYGPKSLTGFKLYVTSTNKCQHCCGSMQTDATCWA